ncbi:hypothetical protein Tco_1494308 [Tanacetum coccineum]
MSTECSLTLSFVNNKLPEWSRFITEVKLNRRFLKESTLIIVSLLKQHEESTSTITYIEKLNQHTCHPSEPSSNQEQCYNSKNRVVVQRCNLSNTMQKIKEEPIQMNNAKGNVVAGNVGGQNRVGKHWNPSQLNPIVLQTAKDRHIARECPQRYQSDLRIQTTSKDKKLLMQAQESGCRYWKNNSYHMDDYHEVHECKAMYNDTNDVDSDADYNE